MNDKNLKSNDIQILSSKEGIASFFATLGYDTEARLPQTATALGITAASLQHQIKYIEQLAVQDDGAEPLYVYLVELTSVTVVATQSLARALRNRIGNYLLVLTNDYERIDFVLLERILPQLSSSNFSQSPSIRYATHPYGQSTKPIEGRSAGAQGGSPIPRRTQMLSTISCSRPILSPNGPNRCSTTAPCFLTII